MVYPCAKNTGLSELVVECVAYLLFRFPRSMSAAEFVDKEVEANNVVIFSKSYCP